MPKPSPHGRVHGGLKINGWNFRLAGSKPIALYAQKAF